MNEQVVKQIADVLHLDAAKLTDALSSEDNTSLDVPKLHTEDELKTFGSNRFNEGKTAFSEIKAKEVKEKYGIEVDGKNLDAVIEAFGDMRFSEANKEPNELVKTLKSEKTELQKLLDETTNNLSAKEKEYATKLFRIEQNSKIERLLPDKTSIDKKDLLTLFNNNYTISKDEDGRTVVLDSNNEIIKDNLLNPVELKDVVATFSDKYILKDGMNGKDRKPSGGSAKFAKMSEFAEYCKDQGKEQTDPEMIKLLNESIKTGNFDYAN